MWIMKPFKLENVWISMDAWDQNLLLPSAAHNLGWTSTTTSYPIWATSGPCWSPVSTVILMILILMAITKTWTDISDWFRWWFSPYIPYFPMIPPFVPNLSPLVGFGWWIPVFSPEPRIAARHSGLCLGSKALDDFGPTPWLLGIIGHPFWLFLARPFHTIVW